MPIFFAQTVDPVGTSVQAQSTIIIGASSAGANLSGLIGKLSAISASLIARPFLPSLQSLGGNIRLDVVSILPFQCLTLELSQRQPA